MEEPGLRLVGSAVVAFAGTMGIVYLLNTQQPRAFVATVTTAIGARPAVQTLGGAGIAPRLMAGIRATRHRYGPRILRVGRTDERAVM